MTSQQRASHPADAAQGGGMGDRDEPCNPTLDDHCNSSFDYIDEAIEESMDASDPPAIAPQTTIGPPDRSSKPADRG